MRLPPTGHDHAEHQAEEQRKATLEALFKAMLHQLMTGRVRVAGWTEVYHEP